MSAAGFIVVNNTVGSPVSIMEKSNSLWKRIPKGGVLFLGNSATVFPTRPEARKAINRTIKYFAKRPSSRVFEYFIYRLEALP